MENVTHSAILFHFPIFGAADHFTYDYDDDVQRNLNLKFCQKPDQEDVPFCFAFNILWHE